MMRGEGRTHVVPLFVGLEASRIRSFFKEFHTLYCDTVSNPFYEVGSPIKSTRFKGRIQLDLTHLLHLLTALTERLAQILAH